MSTSVSVPSVQCASYPHLPLLHHPLLSRPPKASSPPPPPPRPGRVRSADWQRAGERTLGTAMSALGEADATPVCSAVAGWTSSSVDVL